MPSKKTVIELDPILKKFGGWIMLPQFLFYKKISDSAKIRYAKLLDLAYSGISINQKQKKLADILGSSERTIRRRLKELKDAELISWDKNGHHPNRYKLLFPGENGEEMPVPERPKVAAHERPKVAAHERPKVAAHERPKVAAPKKNEEFKNKELPEKNNDEFDFSNVNVINKSLDIYSLTSTLSMRLKRSRKSIREWLHEEYRNSESGSSLEKILGLMISMGDELDDFKSWRWHLRIAATLKDGYEGLIFRAISYAKDLQKQGTLRKTRGAAFTTNIMALALEKNIVLKVN